MSSEQSTTISMSRADARGPVGALPAISVSAAIIAAAGSVRGGGGGSGAFLISRMPRSSGRAGRHCPTEVAKPKANKKERTVPTFSNYSVTIPMSKVEAAKFRSKKRERTITFQYTSVTSSRPVVNAMTGSPYPFNMGSKDMFRCYMITTALHPPKTRPRKLTSRRLRGKHLAQSTPDQDTAKYEKELVRLCYDSPDQYEEHTGWKASPESIRKWEEVQHEIATGCLESNGRTYLLNKL